MGALTHAAAVVVVILGGLLGTAQALDNPQTLTHSVDRALLRTQIAANTFTDTTKDTLNQTAHSLYTNIQSLFIKEKTIVTTNDVNTSGNEEMNGNEEITKQPQIPPVPQITTNETIIPTDFTRITKQPITRIERIIEQVPIALAGVSQQQLEEALQNLNNSLKSEIYRIYDGTSNSNTVRTITQSIAHTNKIDQLSGVTITNATVDGVSGLTDADIPDGITASNYVPLTGATLSGALTVPYIVATSTTASSFAGNFGVGTTSPYARLSVHEPATGTNTTLFAIASSTASATSTLFVVKNDGKVGIGTTPDGFTLDLLGTARFRGDTGNGRLSLVTNDETQEWRMQATQTGGSLIFRDQTNELNPIIVEPLTPTHTLRLDSAGRVGMGTSTPFAKLSLHANNGDTNQTLFAIASSTASATSTLFSVSNTGTTLLRANGTANSLEIDSNGDGASDWTMNSAGDFAFGTQRGYPLSVTRDTSGQYGMSIHNTNANGYGLWINAGANSGAAGAALTVASYNGDSMFHLYNDGTYLGARNGAAVPSVRPIYAEGGLGTNINGANLSLMAGFSTGSGTGGSILFSTSPSGGSGTTANTLTERARVTGEGLFGIGTTSPFAKLSLHANNGDTNQTLFAIASSTASATTTVFNISNDGITTWRDSSGNPVVRVDTEADSKGQLLIGMTSASSVTNPPLAFGTNVDTGISNCGSSARIGIVLDGTCTLQLDGTNTRVTSSDFAVIPDGTNTLLTVSDSSDEAVLIQPDVSTDIGLTIQGATSQSANLQEWQNSAGTVLSSINSAGELLLPLVSDATTPTLAFGDGDSGIYQPSDGQLAFSFNGTRTLIMSSAGLQASNGNGGIFREVASSFTVPAFAPRILDNDTGIGGDGSDGLAIVIGGTGEFVMKKTAAMVFAGVGTTSPTAKFGVHAANGQITNGVVFVVASSTASATVDLLKVANTGDVTITGSGGTCTITGAGACSSDVRLKKDVNELSDTTLTLLNQMRAVTYRMNAYKDQETLHLGFIAQEVQPLFPEAVAEISDSIVGNHLGIRYDRLIIPAIKSIQELDKKVEMMRKGTDTSFVEALVARMATMLVRVKRLVVNDELCIGSTCVTESQLQDLLSGTTSSASPNQPNEPTESNNPPTITLIGNNPATITLNTSFIDPGAYAEDTEDGPLMVDSTGTVDTETPGEYTLTYTTYDLDLNYATTTRTVLVTDPSTPTPLPTASSTPPVASSIPPTPPAPEEPAPVETASSTPPTLPLEDSDPKVSNDTGTSGQAASSTPLLR